MRLKGRPVNHLALMVVSCTTFILLYTFSVPADREQEELVCKRSPEAMITHSKAKCQKLRRIFATLSVNKTINERSIMRNAVELQRCPWLGNRKKKEFYRSEINQCCKTSHELILTQENTQVGEDIVYETQKSKKINVTTKIFNMFPKESPFSGKAYKTCAVVGNGAILVDSCCGQQIDQAEFVFRFNLPPLNYTRDAGRRVDLVTANPSIMINRFQSLNQRRKAFGNTLREYQGALILMAAFSHTRSTQVAFKVQYTLDDFGLGSRMLSFHPVYLENLAKYWRSKGLYVKRLSSGIMLVSAAMELCDSITLYGFWPFYSNLEGRTIGYHYYDKMAPNIQVHAMPKEFLIYSQMHAQGALKLQVGQCS
ncbi:alpha-2,8-sialyltransferase 8E-like isoform X2 [Ambystoma mexicanum]|uniref:alpha-2,8-sialyltransferase 8E-like isoform X2 n=1 Tax=Ambystoma mexicanum TaxID=8296 RepID=UPI0037E96EC2